MPAVLFSDITLPGDAKYYGFTDLNSSANPEWDIVWSFTYALTGFNTGQHAFCTFLTTNPLISAAIPGWYLGYLGHKTIGDNFIVTEDLEIILDETSDPLLYDSMDSAGLSSIKVAGVLAVAFDSTGYFALSDDNGVNPGVAIDNAIPNSLIVRDQLNNVIFNSPLASLNPNFVLFSDQKYYQTLRFRLNNSASILAIEFKPENDNNFQTLALVNITPGFVTSLVGQNVYTGFSYCSPLSSLTIDPSTLYLKNFSVQTVSSSATYEIVPFTSIFPSTLTYTSISGVTDL